MVTEDGVSIHKVSVPFNPCYLAHNFPNTACKEINLQKFLKLLKTTEKQYQIKENKTFQKILVSYTWIHIMIRIYLFITLLAVRARSYITLSFFIVQKCYTHQNVQNHNDLGGAGYKKLIFWVISFSKCQKVLGNYMFLTYKDQNFNCYCATPKYS